MFLRNGKTETHPHGHGSSQSERNSSSQEYENGAFEPQSALEAFEGFEKSTLAVTMRLHACIFALAGQTPLLDFPIRKK